jgi:hypothetical protein
MKKPKKKPDANVNMRQPVFLMAKVLEKMGKEQEALRMKHAHTLTGLVFCALRDYTEGRWKP